VLVDEDGIVAARDGRIDGQDGCDEKGSSPRTKRFDVLNEERRRPVSMSQKARRHFASESSSIGMLIE
jgi:hypothetical protein